MLTAVLVGWLPLSVAVALVVGRMVRIADAARTTATPCDVGTHVLCCTVGCDCQCHEGGVE